MLEAITIALATTAATALLICGIVVTVQSIVEKDLPILILGSFVTSISGIILIGLFTAPVEPKKFCLTINDTQQTVSNFEINTRYIFYWGDNEAGETEQYRVPSVATNIYFVEGECENGK